MDDPLVVEAAEALPDGIEKITFGSGEGVSGEGVSSDEGSGLDVRITEVVLDKEAAMVDAFYEVRGEEVNAAFASPLLTNAANGAAAIAGALALGATIDDIRGALASVSALPGRMEVIRCASCTVIDDSYNANPESMEAALTTLAAMGRPKVAVLGDMLELGDLAWQAHRSAGKQAAEAGVRKLVAIGERAGEIAQGAISAGMKHVDVLTFSTAEGAVEAVENFTSDGDTVLVKGSRGVGLDKVVQKLKTRG
jgi:UDP-N-acetylmuramoyl-tripeptide--D-alanyl-D-alanine ligase